MTESSAKLSDPGKTDSAKKADDPELTSVKRLIGLLDRTFRNSTIYGMASPTSRRFIDQFHAELTAHILRYGELSVVVQGFRLFCKGAVVYENPSPMENLAFKLFADGIRELSFKRDITSEDITYFLETLGGDYGTEIVDEDIVSRLWQKNLLTISLVTAEEIMKSLDSATVMRPQNSDRMNNPVSQVSKIHRDESARQAQQKTAGTATQDTDRASGSDLAQYQVSKEELDKLAREIEEESRRKNTILLMEMLTAILVSEQSPATLLKVLDVCEEVLKKLIEQGHWEQLNTVLNLLDKAEQRLVIASEYRQKRNELMEGLAQPALLNSIAAALNPSPRSNIDGLLPFLLRLTISAVPALCTLLSRLKHHEHRAVVCQALVVLAKDEPEPLLKQLSHPAGDFVIDVINVLIRLVKSHEEQVAKCEETYGNVGVALTERVANSLAQVAQHKDGRVKREAIRVFGTLCPTGSGIPLLAFVSDSSDGVRLAALKQLANGRYAVPFSTWRPIISDQTFLDRRTAEKHATFLAISQTAKAEAVPYWRELLTRWSWINRAQVRELATLAAEFLGKEGTPEAISALEQGMKRWDRTIRLACQAARAVLDKRPPAEKMQAGGP